MTDTNPTHLLRELTLANPPCARPEHFDTLMGENALAILSAGGRALMQAGWSAKDCAQVMRLAKRGDYDTLIATYEAVFTS
jgi:hypothetical protein